MAAKSCLRSRTSGSGPRGPLRARPRRRCAASDFLALVPSLGAGRRQVRSRFSLAATGRHRPPLHGRLTPLEMIRQRAP